MKKIGLDANDTLITLKAMLEREGIPTSWQNPLFHRLGGDSYRGSYTEGLRLYIPFRSIPGAVPADLVTASVSVEHGFLYFSLLFYFYSVLNGALETSEIESIWDLHDSSWFPFLADHFQDIQELYSLVWDIEYDAHVEDSLDGRFALGALARIVSLILRVKSCIGD